MKKLISIFLLVVSCQKPPVAPVVPAEITCSVMCNHLRDLKCESGFNTKGGASCESVCKTLDELKTITFNKKCIYEAQTCNEINECE